MANLNLTRTFTNAVNIISSWWDDNFSNIQNWLNGNLQGGSGNNDTWWNAAKVGNMVPSNLPSANQVVATDGQGNITLSGLQLSYVGSKVYLSSNATYASGAWKFIGTGYATAVILDIANQAAPQYVQSTASGAAGGAITWGSISSIALISGGTVDTAAKANSLLEIVSGLYRQASRSPGANQIVVLDSSGNLTPAGGMSIGNPGAATNILGSSVQVNGKGFPVADEAGLKIIRGTVNSDGTVALGSGFSSVKNATGNYTVTFTVAFSAIPSVTATDASGVHVVGVQPIISSMIVITYNATTGVNQDAPFGFIAIGPK